MGGVTGDRSCIAFARQFLPPHLPKNRLMTKGAVSGYNQAPSGQSVLSQRSVNIEGSGSEFRLRLACAQPEGRTL